MIEEVLIERAKWMADLTSDPAWMRPLQEMISVIVSVLKSQDGLLLACGNGGSASQAEHLVGELVGRFLMERRGLPAVALTSNSTVVTAISNDYAYGEVFARQVKAYAGRPSTLLVLSTSGRSDNLVQATRCANELGIPTLGLLGRDGGDLGRSCGISVIVPSQSTPFIQEVHQILIHAICGEVDREVLGGS